MRKKIVVIGGGITGLSSTFYLKKELEKQNLDYELVLLEAGTKVGGKIDTMKRDGYIIERGPDSFLRRKPEMQDLVKDLGMEDCLVENATGENFVLAKQGLHAIPKGSIMGIPTRFRPFFKSRLLSSSGKFRVLGDLFLGKKRVANEDMALGTFLRARVGDEMVDNILEPLMSGIYAGDLDEMSAEATGEQFLKLEDEHGSLLKGVRQIYNETTAKQPTEATFLTVREGLSSVVSALEQELSTKIIKKGKRVQAITRQPRGYEITISKKEKLQADSIFIALPYQEIVPLFRGDAVFEQIGEIPAASVATVAMVFPKDAVEEDIKGSGFVVSRNEDFSMAACSWIHRKWPHTVPEDKILLRAFVGRRKEESIVDLADKAIEETVLSDLNRIMKINQAPEFTTVTRWRNSIPQYTVGHERRKEAIYSEFKQSYPGIFAGGASFEGVELSECVRQAKSGVTSVLNFLKN
ncbi:protoporphyrinogen oxidase [Listeria booriae]|uniref:Coproporphyrinogen III oxidase n=1 Tax=Listeria booriae TaxID=1552123 RepID=A0A7X0XW53_9LIST|nr:protoporphyrinogen oxidase [Listeria booriae]MBC1792736.1 protoporphyrinogen oxidase [Listeria booriae]MBC1798685.1 protoporphyrinogen oxidase [Listeria booriae]MBC1804731.1 protoporphyrinogen oxidase [Listeria booriae]MBC1891832.1 protoporphyrinogen oxidase [Listeria booriae]MBC1898858.1 protoporphyrinogen oxidase [Listeria booriae]